MQAGVAVGVVGAVLVEHADLAPAGGDDPAVAVLTSRTAFATNHSAMGRSLVVILPRRHAGFYVSPTSLHAKAFSGDVKPRQAGRYPNHRNGYFAGGLSAAQSSLDHPAPYCYTFGVETGFARGGRRAGSMCSRWKCVPQVTRTSEPGHQEYLACQQAAATTANAHRENACRVCDAAADPNATAHE